MTVYLSSPCNQMQADRVRGMPVLISYAVSGKKLWIEKYVQSFGRLLIDCGAFSTLNSGVKVDLDEYAEWAERYIHTADAVAALDDISGDWEQGLENWRKYPWMFPTFHDTDPPEALDCILRYNPKWIGLGMLPGPGGRRSNESWLKETLDRLPTGVHVHGWALRSFASYRRINSFDSTNWLLDAYDLEKTLWWLTPAECVEQVVLRYQRTGREPRQRKAKAQLKSELEALTCEA